MREDPYQLCREERSRQDEKWGDQSHNPATWHLILTEEVGELATAILDPSAKPGDLLGLEHIKQEAVQVMAVAAAFIEDLNKFGGDDA